MKVGTTVRVDRCESCPSVVGKTAVVKALDEAGSVVLSFGRGRPQKGRPTTFSAGDVSVVEE